ncbi:hypothetical protein [Idiomarina sp.]|uniref:hypothetical protein n=1 Tax=Idiomarina sp. TaxID=1874361 RepID=UPI003A95DF09
MNEGLSFFQWIDGWLAEKWPDNVCFNLYEGQEPYRFHVQMIGSESFDEEGEWVCEDTKSTDESVFYFSSVEAGKTWQEGLKYIRSELEKYLSVGFSSQQLMNKNTVAIGFVDGDLEYVHRKVQ